MAREFNDSTVERAYQRTEQEALAKAERVESPRAVILGGQPGSGKSELANQAVREFRTSGGAVVIDADRMREENPRYKELSRVDPQNAADRTHKDAGEWASRLRATAMEGQRNLVVDGTLRDPEGIRRVAGQLRENGYTVEARVIAANPETSMLRTRLRFEEQVAERGVGRYVNQEQHDKAYSAIPKSVDVLEREKLVDKVTVYDAHKRPVYSNELENGHWKREPGAMQAMETERSRALTYSEKRDKAEMLEDIAALSKSRLQVPDRGIEERLTAARGDVARFEQSPAFQRMEAFERLPKAEAMAKHPELDGAYAQLYALRQSMSASMSQDQRERTYFAARAEIAGQLERGEVPKGNVSLDQSKQVLELATKHRGIQTVRDADQLRGEVKGEVVAMSSRHGLAVTADGVGVRFERSQLDKDIAPGAKVTLRQEDGQVKVYQQGQEPAKQPGRDASREFGR